MNPPLPRVDDRIVAPEAHVEIVDGRLYQTRGANPPLAQLHARLVYVLRACVADGYTGALDMLTRADADTDAAPDVSIFLTALDPT